MEKNDSFKPFTKFNPHIQKEEAVVFVPEKFSKKEQKIIAGVYKKILELKGGCYTFEIMKADKKKPIGKDKELRAGVWLKITPYDKNKKSNGNKGI